MIVAGSAAPAVAASNIDFSGYYRAYFLNDINVDKQHEPGSYTDSYFGHRLNIDMTFTPTDEIQVFWRLRAPSFARWGNGGGRLGNLQTEHVYGLIKQDWGNVIVGKINSGLDTYGLGSLGYGPSGGDGGMATYISPFDSGANVDAIRYYNKWDNGFGIMGQYAKVASDAEGLTEPNHYYGVNNPSAWSDGDWDRYQLEATYEWDGGGAALGVRYDRMANNSLDMWQDNYVGLIAPNGFHKTDAWYVNPAIMQSWGDFSVHFEGMAGWGTVEFDNNLRNAAGQRIHDVDADGYGFYLDADYNYGPGHVMLAGWWTSGTDFGDSDYGALVNINQGNFYPLVVAYNSTAGWGGRNSVNGASAANNAFNNYVAEGYNPVFQPGTVFTTATPADLQAGGFGYGNLTGLINGTAAANALSIQANADAFTAWAADTTLWTGRWTSIDGGAAVQNVAGIGPNLLTFQALSTDRSRGIGNFAYANTDGEYSGWAASSPNSGEANHWAIGLFGGHAFTDDISMNYGLAYLALTKPNYRVMENASFEAGTRGAGATGTPDTYNFGYKTQDKDMGVELDLGFTFKLLDNLTFDTTFGYMFNGDAYKSLKGYQAVARVAADDDVNGIGATPDSVRTKAVWEDADDSYVWYNTLTFSF